MRMGIMNSKEINKRYELFERKKIIYFFEEKANKIRLNSDNNSEKFEKDTHWFMSKLNASWSTLCIMLITLL